MIQPALDKLSGPSSSRAPRCRGVAVAFATLVAGALTAPALGITIRNDETYLNQDATLLPGTIQDHVGLLTTNTSGSGVYLGDGWVLTAAHLFNPPSVGAPDATYTLGGTAYGATQLAQHPEWTGDFADGHDFALLKLDTVIPGLAGVDLFGGSSTDLQGDTVTLSGFGFIGIGQLGGNGPLGELHAAQNRIDARGQSTGFFNNASNGTPFDEEILFVDFDDPTDSDDGYSWSPDNALEFEGLIAGGDSGGGVFVDDNGQFRLVGVNSFLLGTDGDADGSYSDIAGLASLHGVLPWIASVTGAAVLSPGDANLNGQVEQGDLDAVLQNWGNTANTSWVTGDLDGSGQVEQSDLDAVLQNWGAVAAPSFGSFAVSAVPEPATAALLALGAAAFTRRRR